MMRNHWLPWVEAQLYQFPTNLTISHNPDVTLIQTMQSIAMTQHHVDVRMRSDLIWDDEFVESGMVENSTLASVGMQINTVFMFYCLKFCRSSSKIHKND